MRTPFNSIIDAICNTPLIQVEKDRTFGKGRLLAKMEYLQPGGSVKDRAALQIIRDAYSSGRLVQGQAVVEMTSGNMGAGLAVVCGAMGNPFIATMSEGNSPERIRILKAMGAQVVLVPQVDGAPGQVTGNDIAAAVVKAKEIALRLDAFYVDQFNNPSSVSAHYGTTGPEIRRDLSGKVDAFVACIGSGGTFIGTSMYLKEMNRDVFCVAVEPENAAILKTGKVISGRHIIQGTGYSLRPPHWDADLCDEIFTVSDADVDAQTRRLAGLNGLYAGYSSGANVCAALKLMESGWLKDDATVVTVLCDTGFKYGDL